MLSAPVIEELDPVVLSLPSLCCTWQMRSVGCSSCAMELVLRIRGYLKSYMLLLYVGHSFLVFRDLSSYEATIGVTQSSRESFRVCHIPCYTRARSYLANIMKRDPHSLKNILSTMFHCYIYCGSV
jgi:hypothetical protein